MLHWIWNKKIPCLLGRMPNVSLHFRTGAIPVLFYLFPDQKYPMAAAHGSDRFVSLD